MLCDLYTPLSLADLAWSRAKLTALAALIDGEARGPRPPRVVLLHGPTGNGKLCTLQVVLRLCAAKLAAEEHEQRTRADSEERGNKGPTPSPPRGTSSTISNAAGTSGAAKGGKSKTVFATLAELEDPLLPASSSNNSDHLPSRASSNFCAIHVLHSSQSSVPEYHRFLVDVLSRLRGEAIAPCVTTQQGVAVTSAGNGSRPSPSSLPSSSATEPVMRAYIVKLYGEPATHRLHECTSLFLAAFEQLLEVALPALQAPRGAGSSCLAEQLLARMRRTLIFLLHTTHDTHSDKIDLSSAFPQRVLDSSALELFHCTPVTTLAMRRRLDAVLKREAITRRHHSADECGPVSHSKGKAVTTASAKRERRQGGSTAATADESMLLSPEEVQWVAEASQGDVRQALLQIQWLTLLPSNGGRLGQKRISGGRKRSSSEEKEMMAGEELSKEAAAIYTRITGGGGSLLSRSAADDRGALTPSPPGAAAVVGAAQATEEDDTAGADVISISSSSPRNSVSSQASSDEGAGTFKSRAGGGPTQASASSKAAITTTTNANNHKRGRSVLDLLDMPDRSIAEGDRDVCSSSIPPTANSGAKRRCQERSAGYAASTTGASATAATMTAAEGRATLRHVTATIRDEYLGLSHATARLLTQTYTLDGVIGMLNVNPRRLLDYLTNNMQAYFGCTQVREYAAVAACASAMDALRPIEDGALIQGGGQLRRNALEARMRGSGGGAGSRTGGRESASSSGVAEQQLDVMALSVFDAAYCALHTRVTVPCGFTAQRPPPFIRSPYPRTRDLRGLSGSRQRGWQSYSAGALTGSLSGDDYDERGLSVARQRVGEADLEAFFAARLARTENHGESGTTPRLASDEVDMLREALPDYVEVCSSLETALLDYAPYARYIVLQLNPKVQAPPPVSVPAPPQQQTISLARRSGVSGAVTPWSTQNSLHSTLSSASFDITSSSFRGYSPSPPPTVPITQSHHYCASVVDASSAGGTVAMTAAAAAASPLAVGSNPRRTVFRFSAAQPPAATAAPVVSQPVPLSRPCTRLQAALLRRGLPVATGLRVEAFHLIDSRRDSGPSGSGGEPRPLLPEGDTIEDFSD